MSISLSATSCALVGEILPEVPIECALTSRLSKGRAPYAQRSSTAIVSPGNSSGSKKVPGP